YPVVPLDQLEEGVVTPFHVGGRDIVVVRKGERAFALRNRCPHMDIRLVDGSVVAGTRGGLDDFEYDEEEPVIVCSWHRYEFSLVSGRCLATDRWRVRSYPTSIANGWISVEIA